MAFSTVVNWKKAAGGSYAAPGAVIGGSHGVSSGWMRHDYASGAELSVAEDIEILPSFEVEVTDITKTLIGYALRASLPHGALTPDLYLQIGNEDYGWELSDCSIDTLDLDLTFPGVWKASFGLMGLGATAVAGGVTQVALPGSELLYRQGETTITINSASMICTAFKVGVQNNLAYIANGDSRSADSLRFPDAINQGLQDITASATVLAPPDFDLAADAPVHDLPAVVVGNNGTTTITLTFANLGYDAMPRDVRQTEDGLVPMDIAFHTKRSSLAVT